MRQVIGFLAVIFCFLVSFAGVAYAEPEALIELAKPVLSAVMSGQYAYAAALALVLMVAAARRYGGAKWPFLRSDVGGSLLVVLGSFSGALASAIGAGGAISLGLMWSALMVAAGAGGMYSLVKRLIVTPILEPLAAKGGVLGAVLGVVLWMFRNDAVAKAEAAGDAAVAAKPSAGAVGIVGVPKDIDSMGGR